MKAGVVLSENELKWINEGSHGASSAWMFRMFTGVNMMDRLAEHVCFSPYPLDPDDLSRCVEMLDCVPEFWKRLDELRGNNATWDALLGEWENLCLSLREELLEDTGMAPRTYKRMREIIKLAEVDE